MMANSYSELNEVMRNSKKVLSYFEFWPSWHFYLPIYIYVIYLMFRFRGIMLPTAANPNLANGQFVGESKDEILKVVQEYLPEYAVDHFLASKNNAISDDALLEEIEKLLLQHHISYPFVVKPDLGCRGAGVNLIKTQDELKHYLKIFPTGQSLICQELIPYESEVGVFYCRLPYEQKGKIISLTMKYFPMVVGDGVQTIKALIEQDERASQLTHIYFPRLKNRLSFVPAKGEKVKLVFAGNHSKGAIFKDGRDKISLALTESFDRISKKLPDFYFGRFDIRYENFELLEQGKNFKIVEINGASAESTHIWDSDCSLIDAWKDLFKQFHLVFTIGEYNRRYGVKTLSFKNLIDSYLRDKKLSKLYPGTH